MTSFVSNLRQLSESTGASFETLLESRKTKFSPGDVLFSLDIETNGPNHDLLEGGLVAFDHTGKELDCYRFSIHPRTFGKPDTMEWLRKQNIQMTDGSTTTVLANSTANGEHAGPAMEKAVEWCLQTLVNHKGKKGYLVCFPAAFDARYWINYCEEYNVRGYDLFLKYFPKARPDEDQGNYRNPFGFNIIDGSSFAWGILSSGRLNLKTLRALFYSKAENEEFDKIAHDAVNDARHQGQLLFRIAALDFAELR